MPNVKEISHLLESEESSRTCFFAMFGPGDAEILVNFNAAKPSLYDV